MPLEISSRTATGFVAPMFECELDRLIIAIGHRLPSLVQGALGPFDDRRILLLFAGSDSGWTNAIDQDQTLWMQTPCRFEG